jgi:hypothetical protein
VAGHRGSFPFLSIGLHAAGLPVIVPILAAESLLVPARAIPIHRPGLEAPLFEPLQDLVFGKADSIRKYGISPCWTYR